MAYAVTNADQYPVNLAADMTDSSANVSIQR
jgi:hypothetical protein